MCAANAAGGTLVILPAVPFRRCGCGGARGLEWCAGVVSVAVSFFRIFHFAAGDALAMLPAVLFGDAEVAVHVDLSGVRRL